MDPRLQNDTAAFRINELVFNGLTTIDQNLEPQVTAPSPRARQRSKSGATTSSCGTRVSDESARIAWCTQVSGKPPATDME
jgi:hypothetical protein